MRSYDKRAGNDVPHDGVNSVDCAVLGIPVDGDRRFRAIVIAIPG
jgi:hypothetical protein